jgi:23S rRNA (pseudouridine1915-N3)-methyltransferase
VKLCVAAIGQRMPAWVNEAWSAYARRFPPTMPLALKEIRMPARSHNVDVAGAQLAEGEALLAAVPSGSIVVALDENGVQWSTVELASRFESWLQDGRDVAFLIGGPDGLSDACRGRADITWSLGRLTFPHAIARVLVAEQLYRAWSVTQNHPYHRV